MSNIGKCLAENIPDTIYRKYLKIEGLLNLMFHLSIKSSIYVNKNSFSISSLYNHLYKSSYPPNKSNKKIIINYELNGYFKNQDSWDYPRMFL